MPPGVSESFTGAPSTRVAPATGCSTSTHWPRLVRSRAASAPRIPMAANTPALRSEGGDGDPSLGTGHPALVDHPAEAPVHDRPVEADDRISTRRDQPPEARTRCGDQQ